MTSRAIGSIDANANLLPNSETVKHDIGGLLQQDVFSRRALFRYCAISLPHYASRNQ
jgi:hypothetical protein